MHNRREFIRDLAGAMGGVFFVGCDLMNAAANPRQEGQKAKRRQIMVGGRRVGRLTFIATVQLISRT